MVRETVEVEAELQLLVEAPARRRLLPGERRVTTVGDLRAALADQPDGARVEISGGGPAKGRYIRVRG